MREMFQEIFDSIDTSANTFGHTTVPVSVLREAIPPEERYEETYLHSHW